REAGAMSGSSTRGLRWRPGWVLALVLAACDGEAPREVATAAARESAGPAAEAEVRGDDPAEPVDEAMVGVLVPQAEVVLVSSGFARLQRLDVQVGDHVGEGEVVAEMDVRGDRTELAAATAAWKASKAELDRLALELEQARATRSDVERLEEFVSKAELREPRFAEKLSAARKRSAGASLERQRSRRVAASTRIGASELRAPCAGPTHC